MGKVTSIVGCVAASKRTANPQIGEPVRYDGALGEVEPKRLTPSNTPYWLVTGRGDGGRGCNNPS